MADISQINLPNDSNNPYDIKDANVPHSSLTAESGGTDLSLVTTGEKYTLQNREILYDDFHQLISRNDDTPFVINGGENIEVVATTYYDEGAVIRRGVKIQAKRWEGTQAQYNALSSYDPEMVYYITDGVSANVSAINDLSDVSILSPQNGQYLMYNSTSQMWTNVGISTACSIEAGPSMPSGFPVPTVTRRGNLVQAVFGIQLPAGTYANTDVLWYINPVPISIARVQIALGGSFPSVNFSADGSVKFNGAQTINSATWFIGQAVYLTDGAYIIHGNTPITYVN